MGDDAQAALDGILNGKSVEARSALAAAIGLRRADGFSKVLGKLLQANEVEVRVAAVEAIGKIGEVDCLDGVLNALADEETRPEAREVLPSFGQTGFDCVSAAFSESTPLAIRWQLPRTISRFDPQPAADVLLEQLGLERNGLVRFRIVRALEALMQRDPTIKLKRAALGKAIEHTLGRAYRFLERRIGVEGAVSRGDVEKSPSYELLQKLLCDKEHNATGRLFRLLGLLHPREDFRNIYRGLSQTREERASSLELIENVLAPPLRGAVLGLVEDLPDRDRLRAGEHFHKPQKRTLEELLRSLLKSSSEPVRDMTVYWIGEMKFRAIADAVDELAETNPTSDVLRTQGILAGSKPPMDQPYR